MAEKDLIEFSGTVEEVLGNSMFRVRLDNDHLITAYTGGKIRKNSIKIVLGDRVDVEMSPYDLNRGRIVYRR